MMDLCEPKEPYRFWDTALSSGKQQSADLYSISEAFQSKLNINLNNLCFLASQFI